MPEERLGEGTSALRRFRSLLPERHKQALRSLHRRFVLGRGIRHAARVSPLADLKDPVIAELTYGWGNESMSAKAGFMRGIARHTWNARGDILECGSGLSTLVAGLIAQRTGSRLWCLEHDPNWAGRIERALLRFGIDCVTVCRTPLRDFGDYTWYDVSALRLPAGFTLVICDGPPGDTPGGRYGLLPQVGMRMDSRCTILLDDAQRAWEQTVLERWTAEFGARHELVGTEELCACVTLPAREST